MRNLFVAMSLTVLSVVAVGCSLAGQNTTVSESPDVRSSHGSPVAEGGAARTDDGRHDVASDEEWADSSAGSGGSVADSDSVGPLGESMAMEEAAAVRMAVGAGEAPVSGSREFASGESASGGAPETGGGSTDDTSLGLPATGHLDQQAYGVLTAGTFDDNANFAAFRDWNARMLKGGVDSGYPGDDDQPLDAPFRELRLGERVEIQVLNESGGPVRGATVEVAVGGSGEKDLTPILRTVTHGNGRALFFTGLDGVEDVTDYVLAVTAPGSDEARGFTVATNDPVWEVKLPYDRPTQATRLDLAFVVDATGSMSDELEYLKLEVGGIVEHVRDTFPDVAQRYALIVYRDDGDEYVTRVFDFTDSLEGFQTDLYAQSADGGGDYEEAVQQALDDAVGLSWHVADSETVSVLFHIADAPPHDFDVPEAFDAVQSLRLDGVTVFPVGASGVGDAAEYLMRVSALISQGQYIFLTDDSGVGDSHAEPHIPCYHVEHLDDAMARMIASELAGGQISPSPDSILRTVGNPVNGVCMPEGPEAAPTPGGATPEPTNDPRQQAP